MVTYEKYASLRDKKGLKDIDVAKKAGVSPSTLSAWKKAEYEPKADKLVKIAEALGIEYTELVGNYGKFSRYNPNRPESQNSDVIVEMSGMERNLILEVLKDDTARTHLLDYARLLKLQMEKGETK